MDTEVNALDVFQSMLDADRAFYQTLRFLNSNRDGFMTIHQRNTATMLSLVRLYLSSPPNRHVTYTATIPINLPSGWNDPVVVHPTSEQISSATEEVTDESATTSNCAICQDSLSPTHVRLTHCGHAFHASCIAEWFTRSVHCPNCRHDVREVGHPAPTSSEPVRTPPRAHNRLASWLVGVDPIDRTADTEGSDGRRA